MTGMLMLIYFVIVYRAPVAAVGWALGYHAGGREFNSNRTNTQGLKITEQKVLPL